MLQYLPYVVIAIVGYLVGSIPNSVLLSKCFLHDDVRDHGSGNPGSTNMLRTYGVLFGILTFVLDVTKGVLAALIGSWIAGELGMLLGAIFGVLGHDYSLWLHFNGGKGAATSLGAMLTIFPMWTAISFGVFLLVAFTTGYVSLASICTFLFVFVMILITSIQNIPLVVTAAILVFLGIYRHRENIKRLIKGTESNFHHK